jgi:hypothetical protein
MTRAVHQQRSLFGRDLFVLQGKGEGVS